MIDQYDSPITIDQYYCCLMNLIDNRNAIGFIVLDSMMMFSLFLSIVYYRQVFTRTTLELGQFYRTIAEYS